MADNTGNIGGEVAGETGVASTTEANMNKDVEAIKKKWGITSVEDAFPNAIKPLGLGKTALCKLRAIATRVPNLAAAQALFLHEARKSDGTLVPFGFSHASRIFEKLKANEISTPDSKAKSTAETASPAVNKSAKVVAPKFNVKAPTASDDVTPKSNLKAPTANMMAAPKTSVSKEAPKTGQKLETFSFSTTFGTKRAAEKSPTKVEGGAIKKARIDPQALSPKNLQFNMIAQPKSAKGILKRSGVDQTPSKVTPGGMSMAAPMNEENSPLSGIMTEHTCKNNEFFTRSEAQEDADTIRVTHPTDVLRSLSKNEKSKPSSTLGGDKLHTPNPEALAANDHLKEESLKRCDEFSRTAILEYVDNIARPEERVLVEEVKRAVAKAVYGLKADIEYIFKDAKH